MKRKTAGSAVVPVRAILRRARGFTLIEVLTAMAVLAIILVLVVEISGGTTDATTKVIQKLGAGEDAKAVLTSLAADLAGVDTVGGLTIFINNSGVNADSVLAFVTQSRGPNAAGGTPYRFISVAYQLDAATGELRRYVQPITWNDQDLVSDAVWSSTRADPSDPANNFSVLAQGVLRFQAVAILDNGNSSTIQAGPVSPAPATATWVQSTINGQAIPASTLPNLNSSFLGLNLTDRGTTAPTPGSLFYSKNRVQALMVGLVAVTAANYSILQKSGKLTQATAAFTTPSSGQTLAEAWEPVLSNGTFSVHGGLGLPQPVVASVELFQDAFPLPNPYLPTN